MTRRKAPRGLAQIAYEAHYCYPGALPWNCAQLATRRIWKRTARAVAREVRKRMATQPRRRAKQRRGT